MHPHSDVARATEPCAQRCPTLIAETLALIGAKWSVPIVVTLHEAPAPLRYAELQRRLGGITPKETAKQLRLLEAAGLVDRVVHPTTPPQVEYALTSLGRTLFPALEGLAAWAAAHGGAVARNQERRATVPGERPS